MTCRKGEAAFYQHNGLMVVRYRAMKNRTAGKLKVAYILSTAHAPAMGHTNKWIKMEMSYRSQNTYMPITTAGEELI